MAHECPAHGVPSFGLRWCYTDLKIRARRGEDLTEEELDFIGMRPNGHRPAGGWHDPGNLGSYELDDGLSAEDSATFSALMAIDSVDLNRDRLEFLGGSG